MVQKLPASNWVFVGGWTAQVWMQCGWLFIFLMLHGYWQILYPVPAWLTAQWPWVKSFFPMIFSSCPSSVELVYITRLSRERAVSFYWTHLSPRAEERFSHLRLPPKSTINQITGSLCKVSRFDWANEVWANESLKSSIKSSMVNVFN